MAYNDDDGRWFALKDRLSIMAVLAALFVLVFMMLEQSVINFRCSLVDFIIFDYNR